MADCSNFHFVTVGTSLRLVRNLWDRVAERAGYRVSHIVHPTYDRYQWLKCEGPANCHFFRDDLRESMPEADTQFLASLESDGVPTVHNMILGDRVVSKLEYVDALAFATLLGRRLLALYTQLKPSVVIGDFDALHSALGLAVARKLGIPWFALSFSTIPPGNVAVCSGLTPATAVVLESNRTLQMREYAQNTLQAFESKIVRAPAYLPPRLLSWKVVLRQFPSQVHSVLRVIKRRGMRRYRRYTDYPNTYSLRAMLQEAFRLRKNLLMLPRKSLIRGTGIAKYAFFGLHMQPEASIDVYAHFFSNQLRVVELISRSLPPTHSLLIKLHKSDVPNYSTEYLARFARLPGVKLVSPYADTLELIRNAAVVFSIQGTIGLEAALMGRPVIVFGESRTLVFPNVSAFGKATDLPGLLQTKLMERVPHRDQIVDAFAKYLAPSYPASENDWSITPADMEIDRYVRLFQIMRHHLASDSGAVEAAQA